MPYPVVVEDMRQAVRFVRANSAAMRIDPDRIAITMGASAAFPLAFIAGHLRHVHFVRYVGVDGRMHTTDLHATLLALMGLDHERLTYRYAGRNFRLTDVAGYVRRELFA